MQGTLILSILSTRSSYIDNTYESDADGLEMDTSQWWVGPEMSFMISTYAIDRDVRIFAIKNPDDEMVPRLEAQSQKSFGDVTVRRLRLTFDDCLDAEAVRAKFEKFGLQPSFALKEDAFLFWRPNDGDYRTKSQPDTGYSKPNP